jgi:hypothetical protein
MLRGISGWAEVELLHSKPRRAWLVPPGSDADREIETVLVDRMSASCLSGRSPFLQWQLQNGALTSARQKQSETDAARWPAYGRRTASAASSRTQLLLRA